MFRLEASTILPGVVTMAGKKNKPKKSPTQSLISPPESVVDKNDSSKLRIGDGVDGEGEPKVFLPGMGLAEGEELEVDPSAYVMLHELNAEWPCLSFDIVRDDGPDERTDFPISGYLVAGTQADQGNKNELYLVRYDNLHKTQVKDREDSQSEEEDSDSDEDEDGPEKTTPRHYCIAIPHDGGVNRIRSGKMIKDGLHCILTASWSDAGKVELWDLTSAFSELANLDRGSTSFLNKKKLKPVSTIKNHCTEGFALAWSSCAPGRLLSGDCGGDIFYTEISAAGTVTDASPFKAHGGSIEDIQWSPSESTVFTSSSVDGTVKVWDIRMPRSQSALSTKVHPCDVNVISWNGLSNHLLVTGADDGVFAVWDLRNWSLSNESVASKPLFANNWHKQSITSVEWNPHDSSILAVSGADDQLTLWDLSIEENSMNEVYDGHTIPSQLLFIHQGQHEIKELHWHPQLSGVLISTALSGFNIFKTISV